MSYGQKLQPGDRWKVGNRWVEWDGEKVVGSCWGHYRAESFRWFAERATDAHGWPTIGAEACCIAQQIIAEDLLP